MTNEEPFLTEQKLGKIIKNSKLFSGPTDIHASVQNLRNEINQMENREPLEISVDVLEEEINKQNPRLPVIKGMLSNFKGISTLEKYIKEIIAFYGLEI
jgi:hypothetical protein